MQDSETENRRGSVRYWANEEAEMNPFFNFAYAAHGLGKHGSTPSVSTMGLLRSLERLGQRSGGELIAIQLGYWASHDTVPPHEL